jgi:NAD-dependent deacetylase
MKNIIVLTGAGISAESGIATFRGADGLWEGHRIEDVATPEAWRKDQKLVLEFYNQRRRNVVDAQPNQAHTLLKELESMANVQIITQNVDDLHERAGSRNILHLHGEIRKSRSTADENLVYDVEGTELVLGDLCEKRSQLRPHIVWFGEGVPAIEKAAEVVNQADVVLIVGTSLQVYPAAGLVHYAPENTPVYVVDPQAPAVNLPNVTYYKCGGSEGVQRFIEEFF